MKAIIFSNSEILNLGLKETLKSTSKFSSITVTTDINIFELINQEYLAVVVIDENYNDCFDYIIKLKSRNNFKVLIIDCLKSKYILEKAIGFGLEGYLLLSSPKEEFLKAAENIYFDKKYYEGSLVNAMVQSEVSIMKSGLSKRELEILNILAKGNTNKDLSNILLISESTIKKHVSNILMKLNCKDRLQAVIVAKNLGLVY